MVCSRMAAVITAAAACLCALAVPATANADWPIYGHDLANSRDAEAAGPPARAVKSLARAWTFKSSTGDFTGTPAVARGVLVAGNYGGWIYALNARTGRKLWSRRVGKPIDSSAAIDPSAPGGATVFVPIAEVGSPRLFALSLKTGAPRWDTMLTRQRGADVFGSPVYWKGTVYIGTSGPNNDNSTARGSVLALSERTGRIRWQTFTVPHGHDGAGVWSTPAIDTRTGILYVGTGNNYHPPTTGTEDSMLALATANGRMVGHYQATSGDSFSIPSNPRGPDFDFGASPNLIAGPDGEPLVGDGQKSGTYWALDRGTMKPIWHTSVGPGGPLGGILGSTAYGAERIYGADTASGQVFALGRTGSLAWQSPDLGALDLAPATLANSVLYTVDPAGLMIARKPATGAILNTVSLGRPSFGGVSAAGPMVYVAVGTGPPPAPLPQSDSAGSIVALHAASAAP